MVLWLKEMSPVQEVSDQLKPACSAQNRPSQLMILANLEVINLGGEIQRDTSMHQLANLCLCCLHYRFSHYKAHFLFWLVTD